MLNIIDLRLFLADPCDDKKADAACMKACKAISPSGSCKNKECLCEPNHYRGILFW